MAASKIADDESVPSAQKNSFSSIPADLPSGGRLALIIGLLFIISLLNYLDRQTLSVLKPAIKTEFSLDESGYALLVNIFTFCYAFAYIGSGWLVDRIGARRALTLFIAGWSIASIGCGIGGSFFAFAAFRALLGIMEPGYFPSSMRVLAASTTPDRRGFLMGLAGTGTTVGAIVAAPLIAWMTLTFSWRAAFVAPGVIGLFFAVIWWMVYRDPKETTVPEANAGKSDLPALPWRNLWSQPSMWGIVLARFISDPVWYFCLFWMPGYFQEHCGLSLREVGMVGWIPFLVGNLGSLGLAFYSDRLGKRLGNSLNARRYVLMGVSCLGPVVMLLSFSPQASFAVAILCIVAVVCLTWLLLLATVVADAFPAGNAASVWAIAGAFGAGGAILFNYSIGQLTTTVGTERMFLVMGGLHLLGYVLIHCLVKKVNPKTAMLTPVP